MGLDTTHDAWHGAYSAFNRWRNQLARVAGYNVEPSHIRQYSAAVQAATGAPAHDFVHETVDLDWGHVTAANLAGKWETVPHGLTGPDPLIILLAHSDCDGEIAAEHCGILADRLAELLPRLPEGEAPGHVRHWREATQRFIDGLCAAQASGEPVEFA